MPLNISDEFEILMESKDEARTLVVFFFCDIAFPALLYPLPGSNRQHLCKYEDGRIKLPEKLQCHV